MAKSKGTSEPTPERPAPNVDKVETAKVNVEQPKSTQPETKSIPGTGLEDYGRWKEMFHEHKRDPKEKPFRRGRIWA